MKRRAVRSLAFWTVVLFAIWLSLPERFTPLHITAGLLGSIFIAWANTDLKRSRSYLVAWGNALLYFPWLFFRILSSGIHICYLVLHPSLPIRPRLLTYRTEFSNNHAALMLLGNSITLTPGTITVEAGDGELVVHALDGKSEGSVTSDRLSDRVSAVFRSRRNKA